MEAMKYLAKLCVVFVGGIAAFFIVLVLVWCIPDEWVTDKQQESLSLFDENGREDEWPFTREADGWAWIFTHARGSQLDNATDYTMIRNVVSDASSGKSVFYKAMDCNDYARYWHGYLIFLRPMMLVFSYMQIRYIYMFIYMMLGIAVMLRINKNFGNRMVYLWAFCSCFIYPVILPFSLQFSSVFFIMMAAILMVDHLYKGYNPQQTGIFFLVLGMMTSYFDFFTAPLLTLGVPLIYLMLLQCSQYWRESLRKNIVSLAITSITWGGGYFGCWGMKWILAGPILKRNVIQDGISAMVRRTVTTYHTSVGFDTGSLRAIAMNLFAILPPGITGADWKWFFAVILIAAIVLLTIFVKFHADKQDLKAAIPFVIVAFYPFIWFAVVSQHTSIHYVFTYRIELITLLGGGIAYAKSIQMHRMTDKSTSGSEGVWKNRKQSGAGMKRKVTK